MRLTERTLANRAVAWLLRRMFPRAVLGWVPRLRELLPPGNTHAELLGVRRRAATEGAVA